MAQKTNVKWYFWFVAALFAALLCMKAALPSPAGGAKSPQSTGEKVPSVPVPPPPDGQSAAKERARAEICRALDEFENEVDSAVTQYETKVENVRNRTRRQIDSGIDWACSSDGLCGFKYCSKLAWTMAVDKIRDTDEAEGLIRPAVDRVFDGPMTGFESACKAEMSESVERVSRAIQNLYDCVGGALKDVKLPQEIRLFDPESLEQVDVAMSGMNANARKLALGGAFAIGEVAMEAAMLKSSYFAIRQMVMRLMAGGLAKPAARAAGAAGTGIGLSLADGPLPIGDVIGGIIAAGGFAWTAYDVNRALNTLPRELRAGMTRGAANALDQMSASCTRQFGEFGEKTKTSMRERMDKILDSLHS